MLRSLMNSMRGRSALAVEREELGLGGPVGSTEIVMGGAVIGIVPQTIEKFKAMPRVTASMETIRPERCCVYCGHGIYAPRGAAWIRCAKCFREIQVQDVTLRGEVVKEEIVTAGRIIVEEDAKVAAKLVATSVDIAGRVWGDVLASNLCTIRATGKQAGKILCRRLDLRLGAEVDGAIELIRDA